ncbi:MAG: type restriction enzyme subunit [Kosmotogales bacterium]|nr:type restriction enzyme subunit [Kosmotogales bacterium]
MGGFDIGSNFTEDSFEKAVIELFRDELGYEYLYGPDIERSPNEVILKDIFEERLRFINPNADDKAIEETLRKVYKIDHPNSIENNKIFHEYLTSGVSVNYYKDGVKSDHLWLVDFKNTSSNQFTICNQFTVWDVGKKRPDIIVFVNGLPLVLMELKSGSREDVGTTEAYLQLKNYMKAIPKIFTYNSFSVISDLVNTKAGTITAEEDRYMRWKSVDGNYKDTRIVPFGTLFRGMFDKKRFLNILENFILFLENKDEEPIKILSAYHQFFAVNKAIDSTLKAVDSDGRAGVFWHTQGSGKSLSMVFYASILEDMLKNPTIVVITDRNDLDDQLFGTFSTATSHLRQTPVQAAGRKNLKELLNGREAGGIIFTTMQKFEEDTDMLSDRKNIVIIADEAHRSQYGLQAKVDSKTGKLKYGMAKYIRDALPNASFIGFTGTPIDSKDRSTREIFGNYIDIYDMTQAVQDEATKPIYYESRVMQLKLDKSIMDKIDKKYEEMARQAEPYIIAKSQQELGQMEAILGAEETVNELCKDIISHYEERKHILEGKAMIVAYSRNIAMKIYNKLLELRPDYKDKLGIVMTRNNQDPDEWYDLIGDKRDRDELGRKFKDPKSELKICIVVDMWLTGFDVPCLNTMYIYKPMHSHTLMQAIARVNRVYGDKEGGLVVDYVGIASALKQAMNDYTKRDRDNYSNNEISETALRKFREELEICRDLMYGLDYSGFFGKIDLVRANLIADGMNYILADEGKKRIFLRESTALKQAASLCLSRQTEREKEEAAYFEAIRSGINKIEMPGKLSLRKINETINKLLKESIHSEGVINVFEDKPEFSIFNEEYLDSLRKIKQKNLAAELLKKLLADEIKIYKRTNLVKSEKFSERMDRLMKSYRNKQISNAEVIEELLKLADEIKKANEEGKELGLNVEEMAFYDAITKPENIKDFYSNEQLIKMTHELTDTLRKSRTIDWQLKRQARSKMSKMIKRLLKKYGYPPEEQKNALDLVLKQAETMNEEIYTYDNEDLEKLQQQEYPKVAEKHTEYEK